MNRVVLVLLLGCLLARAQELPVVAFALEAESAKSAGGWERLRTGHGNYFHDGVGPNLASGEHLLHLPAEAAGRATLERHLPPGNWRLWLRYEYPPGTRAEFAATVRRGETVLAQATMGRFEAPRFFDGAASAQPQAQQPGSPSGLAAEFVDFAVDTPGTVSVELSGQALADGEAPPADRNLDFLYFTTDRDDDWRRRYARSNPGCPLLDAARDALPPVWELQIRNEGNAPAGYLVRFTSQIQRRGGYRQLERTRGIPPGRRLPWFTPKQVDRTGPARLRIDGRPRQPLVVFVRPAGTQREPLQFGPAAAIDLILPPVATEDPVETHVVIAELREWLAEQPVKGQRPQRGLVLARHHAWGSSQADVAWRALWADLGLADPETPFVPGDLGFGRVELYREGNLPTERNLADWRRSLQMRVPPSLGEVPEPTAIDYLADSWLSPLETLIRLGQRPEAPEGWRQDGQVYRQAQDRWAQTLTEALLAGRDRLAETVPGARYGTAFETWPWYQPDPRRALGQVRAGVWDFAGVQANWWRCGQASPMATGYWLEALHHAGQQRPEGARPFWIRQPTPAGQGQSTADFLRAAYSHLAHGARELDLGHLALNEGPNALDYRDRERFLAIRRLAFAVGAVEDELVVAERKPATWAILESETDYLHQVRAAARVGGDVGAVGSKPSPRFAERLARWQRLAGDGQAPAVIGEADLTPEGLEPFSALVVDAEALPAEGAEAVRQWLAGREHRRLYLHPEAGRLDEFGRPTDTWRRLPRAPWRKADKGLPAGRPATDSGYWRTPRLTLVFVARHAQEDQASHVSLPAGQVPGALLGVQQGVLERRSPDRLVPMPKLDYGDILILTPQ